MLKDMVLPLAFAATTAVALAQPAAAEKAYGPGASDTEIRIGQTMPYSGAASAWGTIGRAEAAYFAMINDRGGINGRKVTFISLDDGYSPPKTVEQTRRLVEQDNVLLIFGSLGTATNTAIQKYLNDRKIPQLFVATGATKWADPAHFPWTMGWQASYQFEGRIYAKYLLQTKPDAKIAILYQNDDYGRDYVKGLKDGLAAKAAAMIAKEASYEASDATVDSQVVTLQASGADVFLDVTAPKFAAQAIRKSYDIGWHPLHLLNGVSASRAAVLVPAGIERSRGIITALSVKDPSDPQWMDSPDRREWGAWMDKYFPDGDKENGYNAAAFGVASALVQVLKQCGDDLTRENVMRQAANLKNFTPPMELPGITANTSPTDYAPIKQMRLARFDGERWQLFGEVISATDQ